jgi:hypothetical protein
LAQALKYALERARKSFFKGGKKLSRTATFGSKVEQQRRKGRERERERHRLLPLGPDAVFGISQSR